MTGSATLQPSDRNESAITLAWLMGQLDLEDRAGVAQSAWRETVALMQQYAGRAAILQLVDWISDFWICRGANRRLAELGGMEPTWMPPPEITQWPELDAREVLAALALPSKKTNHERFRSALTAVEVAEGTGHAADDALSAFLRLKAHVTHGARGVAQIQTEHVRAWLASAIGHMLMAVPLTPRGGQEHIDVALSRLALAGAVAAKSKRWDELGDRRMEILYNAHFRPDGALRIGTIRVGQGEEWRYHWLALSVDLDAKRTRAAVQNAAKILRCPTLISALRQAISSGRDTGLLAVGVIRRWLLTIQAMAWLEDALQESWTDVLPKDLCCFALNATKPDWPRRTLVISHRSADVKPDLRAMKVWKAGRCAIDANYIPSWETNLGMIWGLFAPTPIIARVRSPAYEDSPWCRRELELTEYLGQKSDFVPERRIIDVDVSEVRKLDAAAGYWESKSDVGGIGDSPEFPPMIETTSPTLMAAWETAMYRASAALRLLSLISDDTPDTINRFALALQDGETLPARPITNNPNGWAAYTRIFQEVREAAGCRLGELAVALPSDYSDAERLRDARLGQQIPDLQHGSPKVRDILVAFEWLRTEWPQYDADTPGDFLCINVQGITADLWEQAEEVSLLRGIAGMRHRLQVPLWVLQRGEQQAESWPLLEQVPIFTQYVDSQYSWMLETRFSREHVRRVYPFVSGLALCQELREFCLGSSQDE